KWANGLTVARAWPYADAPRSSRSAPVCRAMADQTATPGDRARAAAPAPPAEARFPAYPATWYLFGHRDELRRGPVSKDLLGRRLVAFRTGAGRAAVLDARCAHLGADLGRGRVVGDGI